MTAQETIATIPNLSSRAFWDTNVHTLDVRRYASFIIVRVFERGTAADIAAIIAYYGNSKIINTLTGATTLLPAAMALGKQFFNLSDTDFKCFTNKPQARIYSRY